MGFPYISRIHTAYIGEDSSILGTWNVWWWKDRRLPTLFKGRNQKRQPTEVLLWRRVSRDDELHFDLWLLAKKSGVIKIPTYITYWREWNNANLWSLWRTGPWKTIVWVDNIMTPEKQHLFLIKEVDRLKNSRLLGIVPEINKSRKSNCIHFLEVGLWTTFFYP